MKYIDIYWEVMEKVKEMFLEIMEEDWECCDLEEDMVKDGCKDVECLVRTYGKLRDLYFLVWWDEDGGKNFVDVKADEDDVRMYERVKGVVDYWNKWIEEGIEDERWRRRWLVKMK